LALSIASAPADPARGRFGYADVPRAARFFRGGAQRAATFWRRRARRRAAALVLGSTP